MLGRPKTTGPMGRGSFTSIMATFWRQCSKRGRLKAKMPCLLKRMAIIIEEGSRSPLRRGLE